MRKKAMQDYEQSKPVDAKSKSPKQQKKSPRKQKSPKSKGKKQELDKSLHSSWSEKPNETGQKNTNQEVEMSEN